MVAGYHIPIIIVLLSADPLKDVRNTEAIWRVIKDGRLFDPDTLGSQASAGNAVI